MRGKRTSFVVIAICLLAGVQPAFGGTRVPKTPGSGGVKVTTSGNQVKYTVRRDARPGGPGKARVNPGTVTCKRWSTFETTVVDGVRQVIEHRWRQCFSTVTGRPTGPTREVTPDTGGTAPSEEVWTAVVPDPVLLRQNGVRFVTQRAAWVWLPPQYFRGISVDLRSTSGEVRRSAATARAVQVVLQPGWGGPGRSEDCTTEAQFPYDSARDFWDQLSCGLWFMKSSVDEPGGAYAVTTIVEWQVNAIVDGEVADTATVVTDSQTAIRVEELQALVTCVGASSQSCPTANKSGR